MKMKLFLKKSFLLAFIFALFIPILNVNRQVVFAYDGVYLGGFVSGFSLETEGASIIGLTDVLTNNGLISPAKEIGIRVGDVILSINGQKVNNAKDIENTLKDNEEVILEIKRTENKKLLNVKPAKDINGKYKLGVFIRDNVNGIGTVTFIKGNKIASLGHPVLDEGDSLLTVKGGKMFKCAVTGVKKGIKGIPGELHGIFIKNEVIANVDKNTNTGIFGELSKDFDKSELVKIEVGTANVGSAEIVSTIDGFTSKRYAISIIKVESLSDTNKNFVIKIDDKELIEKTGGIVQGMSGSPIIQNGKLVGAVTHVFINDPIRGFGISIDKMLNNI